MAAIWLALAGLALSAIQGGQRRQQSAASRGQQAVSDRQKTTQQNQTFQPTALGVQAETPTTPPTQGEQTPQDALGQEPTPPPAQQGGGSNVFGDVQQALNFGSTLQGLSQGNQAGQDARLQAMLGSRAQPQMQAFQPTAEQFQQQVDPRLQELLRLRRV